jgi:hypothetical protein
MIADLYPSSGRLEIDRVGHHNLGSFEGEFANSIRFLSGKQLRIRNKCSGVFAGPSGSYSQTLAEHRVAELDAN